MKFAITVVALLFLVIIFGCDGAAKTEEPKEKKPTLKELGTLQGDVTYTLDDGEELNKLYPDSFWIPPLNIRQNLSKGQTVKLIFRITNGEKTLVERMWVIVNKITSDGYVGALDNDPYCTKKLSAGLEVSFQPKHVIQIYEDKKVAD